MVNCIGSLGRCHVVGFRAHAADAVGQQRHFFDRAADAETLETAQLRDLEIGVCDFAFFIQEDFDLAMAFQPGDRVDVIILCMMYVSWHALVVSQSCFQAGLLARSREPARLKR